VDKLSVEQLSKEYGLAFGLGEGVSVEAKDLLLFGIYKELYRMNDLYMRYPPSRPGYAPPREYDGS
jgi:hypothetical protein